MVSRSFKGSEFLVPRFLKGSEFLVPRSLKGSEFLKKSRPLRSGLGFCFYLKDSEF